KAGYVECLAASGDTALRSKRAELFAAGNMSSRSWDAQLSSVSNAVELSHCADKQAVASHRRSRHAHFFQRIFVQQLVLRTRLEDKGVAVLAQGKYFSIGRPRRGRERERAIGPDPLLLINLLSAACVTTAQKTEVEKNVKIIAIYERRRIVRSGGGLEPGDECIVGLARFERNVAGGSGLEGK